MELDPRTPVVVGVGQVDGRSIGVPDPDGADGADAPEPVEVMAEASRNALADARAHSLASRVGSVRVVSLLSWRYRDPGRLVGSLIGAEPQHTALTGIGGNQPQEALAAAAADVAAGRTDVALVTGGESWRTRMRWRARGSRPPWTRQDDDVAPSEAGVDVDLSSEEEAALGLTMPTQVYPLFEQAVRIADGRTVDEQLVRASQLWARFSEVAADNPYAWARVQRTAEEIRTPGPDNRWIGWPYPKLMNSNNNVDQASAVLVCSAEAADAAGVPREQWVFPHSSVTAHDTLAVTHRPALHRSPAIRAAGRRALELAGTGVDDLATVDLYSCFPSAVQVAAAEIGLPVDDPSRPLTVTGGLSFAGGPWNNYVGHAIATTVERLREGEPDAVGLVTANGGFLTKHAIGVYGARPAAGGFRADDVQDEVDKEETVPAAPGFEGAAEVESWTVMHGRDGEPERAFAALRTPAGARVWGTSTDADVLATLLTDDVAGTSAVVAAGGEMTLD
jgi:acetyl-CoA C-acetyltransferase